MRIRNTNGVPQATQQPSMLSGIFGLFRAASYALEGGDDGPLQTPRHQSFRAGNSPCCNARRQVSSLSGRLTR
jgi:hypothetical protein